MAKDYWTGERKGGLSGKGLKEQLGGYDDGMTEEGRQLADFERIGRQKFEGLGSEADREREYLRKIARGEESVSAQQLSNSLQQNQAQQQSMAAGARGGNQAMAARQAAMMAGRQGAGLAGQQATAGIQERQAASQGLSNMLMQQRGQELQRSGVGSDPAAGPGKWDKGKEYAKTIAQIYAMSDERGKHDIRPGAGDADRALRGLESHVYRYNDEGYGEGDQLGVMAQNLEAIGLGHVVEDTPEGKMINGPKLALAVCAILPGINKRLEALEAK
jgi:hypothetical protein